MMAEEEYLPLRKQLPYGGAVDIHGNIIWKVTKEEHDEMMARVNRIFGLDDQNSH